jgi:thiamine-phosphate pyrophosphorylase
MCNTHIYINNPKIFDLLNNIITKSFKEWKKLNLCTLAADLMALLKAYSVPLIIDDHVDVALAVGAHGVHLGQADMDPAIARKLLGPTAIIGHSTSNLEQMERANAFPPGLINYVGVGPVSQSTIFLKYS